MHKLTKVISDARNKRLEKKCFIEIILIYILAKFKLYRNINMTNTHEKVF